MASAAGSGGSAPSRPPAPASANGREDWDPLRCVPSQMQRRPTPAGLRRLRGELAGLRADPLPGVHVVPDEEVATLVHALVTGPEGTPYAGGLFHFVLDTPDTYPHSPPRARLLTTGNGTVRFNPQFYTSGKVCLSILHTWPGPGWQPTFTLRVVLLQLQALMNELPALNEPWMMLTSDPEEYNLFLRHETLRVAVLGVAEEAFLALGFEGTWCSNVRPENGAPPAVEAAPLLDRWALHPLPAALATKALHHFAHEAERLEARCRADAAVIPDGAVLRGIPRSTQTRFAAMACSLRPLAAAAAVAEAGVAPWPAMAAPAAGAAHAGEEDAASTAVADGDDIESGEAFDVDQEEAAECRICGSGVADGELLRPCGCSGSIAFVHRRCVAEWIRRNGSPVCPICRQAYSDARLRALGAAQRVKRHCAEVGNVARFGTVLLTCVVFNAATGARLWPLEISPAELRQWTVRTVASGPELEGTDARSWGWGPYRLASRRCLSGTSLVERWRCPLVEGIVLHAVTPWSDIPVPITTTMEDLAAGLRLRGPRRPPLTLAELLARRRRRLTARQASLSDGPHRSHWQGAVRCGLGSVLDPLPAVTLEFRPPCAARVAAIAVLFFWVSVGRRSLVWFFMSIHMGMRFHVPAPALAIGVPGLHMAVHQVQRWLARRGMLRRRPPLEGDALLIGLLFFGVHCAGGAGFGAGLATSGSTSTAAVAALAGGEAAMPAAMTATAWIALALLGLYAATTVAKRPEGRQDARTRAATALPGILWFCCGVVACVLAAGSVVHPLLRQAAPAGQAPMGHDR